MSTKPLILDGRQEREGWSSPFNAVRITPRIGDVYRVTATMSLGKGKTVRCGVIGQVLALGPNSELTIELPFTKGGADNSFESGIDSFKLKEREWQRCGQIVLSGLDERIPPTPSELVAPAGPFVAPIPPRVRNREAPEIAGHPRKKSRNRRSLGG